MNIAEKEVRRRMEHFQKALHQKGIKVTHQRMEIYREVARSSDHPNVEVIFRRVRERVPTISLDTVYRTMWTFVDMGLVQILGSSKERVRFDGNNEPHHHFVCTVCGAAADFTDMKFDALPVPKKVRSMGKVISTHVEFRGLCKKCKQKKASD